MTEWNSPQQAGRFVEAYADAILRLCLTYSLTREDAQDICQDIFLGLLEDDRQFVDGGHEKAFVLRCAINACKDLLKSAGRRRTVPMDQAELLPAPEREDSPLPDGDPGDNHMSFLMEQRAYSRDRLRGETVDIVLRPFVDCWWTDFGTERAEYHEGNPMTEGIQDHQWTFRDVKLDYPDQTIRLEPDRKLACLGGTAVLTGLEVSPLSVRIHLEKGGCAYYLACLDRLYPDHLKQKHGSVTVSSPDPAVLAEIDWMDEELAVEVWLKDGTRLTPTSVIHKTQGTRPGGTPYLERGYRYDETDGYGLPTWAVDPAQVDHVTVCGVEIPVSPAPAE